jgi:hypothetical protein
MTQANTTTNAIIKDVVLYWVHLGTPVSPFGTDIYDLQVQVPKKRAKELEGFGPLKDAVDKEGKKTGFVSLNLKKKAFKADGSPAAKVRVVDGNKKVIEDVDSIGNGSVGNVIVMQKPYEIKAPNGKVTKSGISTTLSAVQVTKLVKYESKGALDMFESEGGDDEDSGDDSGMF